MSELSKTAKYLVEIGWSEYESRTYTALALLGKASASLIAKKSGVPTNRVYQILEKLIGKGFVSRISAIGLTTIYTAIDISEFLEEDLIAKQELYKNAISSLEVLKERHDADDVIKSFTIYGSREVSIHLHDLIERAEKEIYFFVDTLVELRNGNLLEIVNEKAEDLDIEMKLLTSPRGINDAYEKQVFKELIDVELRITDDNLSTILLLVDEKELIFVSYAQLTDENTPRDYFGLYLQDRKSIRMFLRIFNLAWELAIMPETEE